MRVPVSDGIEERFVLSDLGTAFGKIAGRPTRWNLTDYKNSDFIRGIAGDALVFCHGLDMQPPFSNRPSPNPEGRVPAVSFELRPVHCPDYGRPDASSELSR